MAGKMPTNLRKNRIIVPLLLAALVAFAAIFGGVYAKYIRTQEIDGTVSAPNFYFESDYLTVDGKEYTLNAGTTSVTFSLMNYADELRVSEVDVAYTVTVTGGADVSQTSGKFTMNSEKKDTITLNNLENGKTYTVTATGTGGFKKTLSATFTVNAAKTGVYKYVEETEHYVLLTVWTENVSGNAEITFPAGLIPDNTDTIMENVKSADVKFEDTTSFVNIYSSRTYRFFKSSEYTNSEFTVTVNNQTAESGTP